MIYKHKDINELISYQRELVDRELNKFIKEESSKNRRSLVKAKIQLDSYIYAKTLFKDASTISLPDSGSGQIC